MTNDMKTPQVGEWWIFDDDIFYCCGKDTDGDSVFQDDYGSYTASATMTGWHHEPRCTGFDWVEPPAPDPGEGYEILPKGTTLEDGDECLQVHGNDKGHWHKTMWVGQKIGSNTRMGEWYRRKIKPVESPDDWVRITNPEHIDRDYVDESSVDADANYPVWTTQKPYHLKYTLKKWLAMYPSGGFRCRRKDLPKPATTSIDVNPGAGYRWLEADEIIKATDEVFRPELEPMWVKPLTRRGHKCGDGDYPVRRRIEPAAPPVQRVRLWVHKTLDKTQTPFLHEYPGAEFREIKHDADGFFVEVQQ